MTKTVCIFSSSSTSIDSKYIEIAQELGQSIGREGWSMVFGGGLRGLMGASARGVHETAGKVIGVIPEKIHGPDITYMESDELVITQSLRERKTIMDARADAFVALPGGIGTLEEIIEALTLKQLGYHTRPVIFYNAYGFYDGLFRFFDHMVEENCYKVSHQSLYEVVDSSVAVIETIRNYHTPQFESKFA